jgi:hypothetical protein
MGKSKKRKNIKRKTIRVKNSNISVLVGGDEKCIFVPMHDGLGNQLFVYAAALVAKKKLGIPLCILPASMSGHSDKNYRKFLFTNSKSVESSDPAIKERMNRSTAILGKAAAGAHAKWMNTNIVANTSKNVILPSTYFQNYQAIKGIIPEMREQIVGALEKLYGAELKNTIDSATSGFMHVRRGDYDKTFGRALSKNYYQDALNEISKVDRLKKIYVFSNDLEWCKGQGFTIGEGKSIEMMDQPDELKSLYLMSLCKRAAIISASTFSTWAAVFGAATNTNPVIVYPKKWFLAGESSALELPTESEGWKCINTE